MNVPAEGMSARVASTILEVWSLELRYLANSVVLVAVSLSSQLIDSYTHVTAPALTLLSL